MRYGYFDEEKKEYVITRPDTPAPWVNYLGSPEYGAIVFNNAGGYSFAKSGANGRILRYIFNKCSKNSPTSSGGEMNCTSEHVCSRKSYDTERTLVLITLM